MSGACTLPGCENPQRTRGVCGGHYKAVQEGRLDAAVLAPSKQRGTLADSPLQYGITYRQLDHWVRKGYLRPDGADQGTGAWRGWPPTELFVAERMALLVAVGLSPDVAARAARQGPEVWLSDQVKVSMVTP